MLPVGSNNKSTPCSVISSNCVSWQGPDIPCIGLCKGDTVTDVVSKLGELVCDIDTRAAEVSVNVSCLGGGDFVYTNYNDLIQYITDKLCDLYTIVDDLVIPTPISLICDVAPCLQAEAGATTLPVVEYAELIGNEFCDLETTVTNLSSVVSGYGTSITTINNTLSTLPTTYSPINSTYVCLGTGTATIAAILATVEQELCDLEAVTGTPAELAAEIVPFCDITNQPALSLPGTMASAYPNWKVSVSTLADTINNIWIALCDMRGLVTQLQDCCTKTCADIDLGFFGILDGSTLSIFASPGSVVPTQFVQCPTPSSTVTITDTSSNSATYTFSNITGILDGSTSRDFDLSSSSLNLAEDFTVSVSYCFFNSTNDLTCQNTITFPVINTVGCPTVTLTSSYLFSIGEIQYSFVNLFSTSPTTAYRINVYDATLALVSTTDTNAASLLPNPVTGAITGLTLGNYYFEIQVLNTPPDGIPTVIRTCPKQLISIVSTGCVSPTSVEAYLIN
jgi:hypothetical protein